MYELQLISRGSSLELSSVLPLSEMHITGLPSTYFHVYLIEKLTAGLVRLDMLGELHLLERPWNLACYRHDCQLNIWQYVKYARQIRLHSRTRLREC